MQKIKEKKKEDEEKTAAIEVWSNVAVGVK